jgi:hypothetical protein
MYSHESGGYWRNYRWPSNGGSTWPSTEADDWWLRYISGRYHVVLSAYELDDHRSECRYLLYQIWTSSCVVVSYPRPLHLSSRDPTIWSRKGTSDLAIKLNWDTHTTRLWLSECLIGDIDVVYFIILFQKL